MSVLIFERNVLLPSSRILLVCPEGRGSEFVETLAFIYKPTRLHIQEESNFMVIAVRIQNSTISTLTLADANKIKHKLNMLSTSNVYWTVHHCNS